jgi:hypothetical protein
MFVRTKIIAGKKRSYLVESVRDQATGKIRQEHIAYVDLWPKKDVRKLVKLIGQYREHLANAEGPEHPKAFQQAAATKARRLDSQIQGFKRAMDMKVSGRRAAVDKRRINEAAGVRHQQDFREARNYYNEFLSKLGNAKLCLGKMEPEGIPPEEHYTKFKEETLRRLEMDSRLIAERHALFVKLLEKCSA